MDTGKKEKKRMSPKAKKIANIIVTSLQVAIVVVTVAISIFVWTTTGRGEPSTKPIQMLAIRSNSMKGDAPDSFNAGDLVIVKAPKDATALEIGTVVTYKLSIEGGGTTLVTHRINAISVGDNDEVTYITKGDNSDSFDNKILHADDIVGIYSGKIKGVGNALLWLQGFERVELSGGDYGWDYVGNTNNFLYVIIIPLIALLLWNGYAMIKVIMEGKLKKARDEAAAAAAAAAGGNAAALDAEEIKRRAIEEYLASLSANSPLAKPPQNQEISGNLDGGSIAAEETGSPQNTSFVGKGETEQSGAPDAQAAASGERQSRRNGGFDNSVAQTAIQPEAPAPQEPVAVEAEPEQNSPLAKSPQNQEISGNPDGGSILSEENAQNGGFDKQPAKPAPKAASKTPAKAPAKTAAKAPAKTAAKAPAKKPKSE